MKEYETRGYVTEIDPKTVKRVIYRVKKLVCRYTEAERISIVREYLHLKVYSPTYLPTTRRTEKNSIIFRMQSTLLIDKTELILLSLGYSNTGIKGKMVEVSNLLTLSNGL